MAREPEHRPTERINGYNFPLASGAVETVANQLGAGLNALGLTSTPTRRRRSPTEMTLYSATPPGQSGQS